MKKTEITMEFMEMEYAVRNAKAYSAKIAARKRKEKQKINDVLYVLCGGFAGATLLGILMAEANILTNLL